MTIDKAKALLTAAEIFFEDSEDFHNCINLNDAFFWASADGEEVPDESIPELADLFYRYGWCGILYWVAGRRGMEKAEFNDVNRFIEFVRHEEQLRKAEPSSSKRAYTKLTYTLGES